MKDKILELAKELDAKKESVDQRPLTQALKYEIYFSDTEKDDPEFNNELQIKKNERVSFKRRFKKFVKLILRKLYSPIKRTGRFMLEKFDPAIISNIRSIPALREEAEALKAELILVTQRIQDNQNLIFNYLYPSIPYDYSKFEGQFYSTDTNQIKEKQSIYLPYLEDYKSGHIVDLGCGEGYFLELLKDNGFENLIGVDSNPNMIKSAKRKNLDIIDANVLIFLRETHELNRKYDVISSFHMIEHLYPKDFLEILQLSFLCLKKGGTLILESPNMDMLSILARGFYMDITHVRPYPPLLLQFLLKDYLGFSNVKIVKSSDVGPQQKLDINFDDANLNKNFEKINEMLYSNQDVGIIAIK